MRSRNEFIFSLTKSKAMWHYFKVDYKTSTSYGHIKESFWVRVFTPNADQALAYAQEQYKDLIAVTVTPRPDVIEPDARVLIASPESASAYYRTITQNAKELREALDILEAEKFAIEKAINHYVHPERYRVIADVLWMDESDDATFRAKALDLDITKLKWAPDPNQAGTKW